MAIEQSSNREVLQDVASSSRLVRETATGDEAADAGELLQERVRLDLVNVGREAETILRQKLTGADMRTDEMDGREIFTQTVDGKDAVAHLHNVSAAMATKLYTTHQVGLGVEEDREDETRTITQRDVVPKDKSLIVITSVRY